MHSGLDTEHSVVTDEDELYHNVKANSQEQCSSDQSDNNNSQHYDYFDGKSGIQHLHG